MSLATLATLLLLQFLDELVSSVVQMKQNFLKCFNFSHDRNLKCNLISFSQEKVVLLPLCKKKKICYYIWNKSYTKMISIV